jgi:hypothetical protein
MKRGKKVQLYIDHQYSGSDYKNIRSRGCRHKIDMNVHRDIEPVYRVEGELGYWTCSPSGEGIQEQVPSCDGWI